MRRGLPEPQRVFAKPSGLVQGPEEIEDMLEQLSPEEREARLNAWALARAEKLRSLGTNRLRGECFGARPLRCSR